MKDEDERISVSEQRIYAGQSMEEVRKLLGEPQQVFITDYNPPAMMLSTGLTVQTQMAAEMQRRQYICWLYGNKTVYFQAGKVDHIMEEVSPEK